LRWLVWRGEEEDIVILLKLLVDMCVAEGWRLCLIKASEGSGL
jgi:hypothetical protein